MHLTPRTKTFGEIYLNTIRISNILTSHHLKGTNPLISHGPTPPCRPVRKQRLRRFRHLLRRHRHGCCGGGGTWAEKPAVLVGGLPFVVSYIHTENHPFLSRKGMAGACHTHSEAICLWGFKGKTQFHQRKLKKKPLVSAFPFCYIFRLFLATSKR